MTKPLPALTDEEAEDFVAGAGSDQIRPIIADIELAGACGGVLSGWRR